MNEVNLKTKHGLTFQLFY
uniref:Uncharacterized protein n=1 Tax=Arundo donax TaxID=35708 RepID=A0A0A9H1L2_ARUDO